LKKRGEGKAGKGLKTEREDEQEDKG